MHDIAVVYEEDLNPPLARDVSDIPNIDKVEAVRGADRAKRQCMGQTVRNLLQRSELKWRNQRE